VFGLSLFLASLFVTLNACDSDFSSCVLKVKDSHVIDNTTLSIPLYNRKRLLFSTQKPHAAILKYDKFLSLYLLEDTHPFAYPFAINTQRGGKSAIVNAKCAKSGMIVQHQIGLNTLGRYNKRLTPPAILTDACCDLEGIVTPKGVIEKAYIQRFITTKENNYADIGVRVRDAKGCVEVYAVDPFFPKNPFEEGDCIVGFDNKKIISAAQFMRLVLFSTINTQHTVAIKRAKHYKKMSIFTKKRYGGGSLSDTFLEREGVYFNKQLEIVSLFKKFRDYGLEIGDKLIQVNGVRVNTQEELRKYIHHKKGYSSLLFERNKFQFFVNIK